ncbi:hypothetical protein D9M68_810360 [compost metagenome]
MVETHISLARIVVAGLLSEPASCAARYQIPEADDGLCRTADATQQTAPDVANSRGAVILGDGLRQLVAADTLDACGRRVVVRFVAETGHGAGGRQGHRLLCLIVVGVAEAGNGHGRLAPALRGFLGEDAAGFRVDVHGADREGVILGLGLRRRRGVGFGSRGRCLLRPC